MTHFSHNFTVLIMRCFFVFLFFTCYHTHKGRYWIAWASRRSGTRGTNFYVSVNRFFAPTIDSSKVKRILLWFDQDRKNTLKSFCSSVMVLLWTLSTRPEEQLCHDLCDLPTTSKSFPTDGLLQPVPAGLNWLWHVTRVTKSAWFLAFFSVKGTERDLSE